MHFTEKTDRKQKIGSNEMKSAYRLRLLAYLLTVFMVAMSAFYWWRLSAGHDRVRNNAIETASKRASQLAEVQGHHVEALLLAIDSSLRQFRDTLQTDNKPGAELIARNVLHMYPRGSIVHLARINVKGFMQYTTVKLSKPVYVGDRDYFQFYQQYNGKDQLFINKPIFSRSAHQWVILITRPIKKNGRFDGAAFISLPPQYFASMLDKLAMEHGDVSTILHEDGTYIARNRDLDEILGKTIYLDRPLLQPDAPRHGVFRAPGSADKLARIYGWYKLNGYPLIVTVGLDEKAILAPVEQDIQTQIIRSMVGNAFMLALSLGLSLLLIRASQQQSALEFSENLFRNQSQRLEHVIWGTDVGTWEWTIPEDEIVVNDRYAEMLGYTHDELSQLVGSPIRGRTMNQLVDPECLGIAKEKMERCFRRDADIYDCELRMRHRDGHWVWVLSRGKIVEWTDNGAPLRMSGTNQDISARKRSEEKLQYIAHYDLLTDLPNRVMLADRMQRAIAQSQRRNNSVAVAYIDLDGFKQVNDLHGHDIGDQLLILLAKRMQTTMREVDTLARIGGDEFVALFVDLENPQDCEPALVRLLEAASDQVRLALPGGEETVMQVSASIGVTVYPQDGGDPDLLLRHADQAMYTAKQTGKNRYHLFDIDQATSLAAQFESIERLRRAFENREFALYYQPKIHMKTGELVGAEALIRWLHPLRGVLLPATFLPIIENHALSIELGDWVIDTALAQIAAWQKQGVNIPVSVNIGARQLQHPNFATRLAELLANHPTVHPSSLELEILETSALEDMAHISKLMDVCRDIGVRFALDDFGTGYSSLTYLKQLPIDVLKIDRTFVHDMPDSADNTAIVNGMISLAQAFKQTVVAEGVETIAQGSLLLSMGCELAQGYAIAYPMPPDELPKWLAQWRPDVVWTKS
ncbi:MAG: EAL domain-containing protein [Oxalobacter sp.]|nr:MAG: EAL domain-containing protein [Oxalobacter sp.]